MVLHSDTTYMKAEDVVEILKLITDHQIEVYVDGGWCVDALVGEQTRNHRDLDITLPHRYETKLRKILKGRDFEEQILPDSWQCNFVLRNKTGLLIDVHTYELDENGKNIFGVPFEAIHLTGTGSINGYIVKCISPEWTMNFHTGYSLDENDYHDVLVLSKKFGLPIPSDYDKFNNNKADQTSSGRL
jgi:lincosamide nucleotidyltransferase A/C/D/E